MLDDARAGGSRAVVIRGEAGIGKSALLDHAVELADDFVVLRTTGYESESEIPFAGLSDILRPITGRLASLPPPQRAALESTLALAPTEGTSHFAVCAATLGVLAAVAEDSPVLVAVDDAHWIDPSSAEALRFTARRLHGEGIAMLLAARPTTRDHVVHAGIPTLELRGLDDESAGRLVDRHAPPGVSDTVRRRLVEASRGNPLALTEIPTLVHDDGLPGRAPLPAGATLERVFTRRLRDVPAATRDALTIAAADQSGELTPITTALDRAGLGIVALEPAERGRIVTVGNGKVSFQHPLLRSTAYHGASLASRCAAHRALADAYELVAGDRAADARAWHLAAATLAPDDDVAHTLHEMGSRARLRGAYVEAARAFERAAELTRAAAPRVRRLTQAAKCWQLAGRVGRAGRLLADAPNAVTDAVARAEVQHLRGYVRMWQEAPVGVTPLLEREAEAVVDLDPDRAARMLADAAVPAFMLGEVGTALRLAERAQRVSRRGGTTTRRVADVMLAVCRATHGDRHGARELLEPAHHWLESQSTLRRAQETIFTAMTAMWLEDLERADALLERLTSECRQHSALGVLPYPLALRSGVDLRLGRWQQGVARAAESVQLAEETHQANAYGLFFLGHLYAARGDHDEADEHLSRAEHLADRYRIGSMPLYTAAARGLLELGDGDIDAAAARLTQLRHDMHRMGVADVMLVQPAGDLAEALVRSGRTDDAARVIDAELQPAARDGSVRAAWTRERIRGLSDGTPAAMEHFDAALDLHEMLSWPFERARTLLCYGEVLRRNRRRADARTRLRTALDLFTQLGAATWAERARVELEATGERITSHVVGDDVKLTPQELQVALAVSEGATNAEAAASLFLSAKTVEYHLSKIYRKAGLSSRDELAELMAAAA
jgi:DNA-binding CsgD family transcriptional regulator/tetratricopeptide (TPR) repeat protein